MYLQALYFISLDDAEKAVTKLRELGLDADLTDDTNRHGEHAVEWTTEHKVTPQQRWVFNRVAQPDSVGWNQEVEEEE